jgi:hypothetical protein
VALSRLLSIVLGIVMIVFINLKEKLTGIQATAYQA